MLGACLSYRAAKSQSVSMIDKLHAAVAHEHKLRFMSCPTSHPTIKLLMKSIRRKYTKPRNPVKPLDISHLRQLNQHLAESDLSSNLVLWRTVWRMNILYYTLCRFSEINCLTTSELTFCPSPAENIDIFIAKSKTDQNGNGKTVSLYSIADDPLICPVSLTKGYLARLSYPSSPKSYVGTLQPRIHFDHRQGYQIPLPSSVIGYSSCLEESKALLAKLGIEGRFGEHSGRRGGATAASTHGGSIQDVQQLGQWKNAACASTYIENSSEQKEKKFRLLYPNSK